MRQVLEIVGVFVLLLLMGAALIFYVGSKKSPSLAASPCSTPQECQYFETLEMALKSSASMQAFRFTEPCSACGRRSFTIAALGNQATVAVAPAASAELQSVLRDTSSYILGGAQKAMPFVPEYGILLGQGESRALLLLATSSKSVRILGAQANDAVLITNIDPVADNVFAILSRTVR